MTIRQDGPTGNKDVFAKAVLRARDGERADVAYKSLPARVRREFSFATFKRLVSKAAA